MERDAPDELLHRALVEHGLGAQLVVSDDGCVRYATPAVRRLLGRDVTGDVAAALASASDRGVMASYLQALRASAPPQSTFTTCAVDHADGRQIWMQVQGINASRIDPVQGLLLTLFDITHYVQRERELRQMATRDDLTGLVNRMQFERSVKSAMTARTPCTAALIDLDQFKQINDRHGHGVGDEVLRTVAARLVAEAPPDTVVARVGGDEFALLLPGVLGPDLERRVDAMRARVSEPWAAGGREIEIGLSIGLSVVGPGPFGKLMRDCDTAMYAAKIRGRGQVVGFGPDAEASVLGGRSIADRMSELLQANQRLRREAETDALTGLANARALNAVAATRVGHPPAPWARCAVLFIDIDHFGRFNHRYGDAAGDVALRTVAQCLRQAAREGDHVFRKGGEEFVAVLPQTDLAVAIGVGERMRRMVQGLGIPHADGTDAGVVTVLVAVAEVADGDTVAAAIAAAGDAAMAQKLSGPRNRVVTAGPA